MVEHLGDFVVAAVIVACLCVLVYGLAWLYRPLRFPDLNSIAAIAKKHSLVRLVVTSKGGVVVETGQEPQPVEPETVAQRIPGDRARDAKARLKQETAELLMVHPDQISDDGLPAIQGDD